jgi:hypothetical protein
VNVDVNADVNVDVNVDVNGGDATTRMQSTEKTKDHPERHIKQRTVQMDQSQTHLKNP